MPDIQVWVWRGDASGGDFMPYKVAADGPFTISMFSISSGLRSFNRLGLPPPLVNEMDPMLALMRMPSIT